MLDGLHPFLPGFDHPLLVSFLHRSIIELAICTLVLVAASLCTAPPPPQKLATTTLNWGLRPRRLTATIQPEGSWIRDYRPWMFLGLTLTTVLWYLMR